MTTPLALSATRLDAAVNLGTAAALTAAPAVWTALGLPEKERAPFIAGLVASGTWHSAGTTTKRLTRTHLLGAAAINAGWVAWGARQQQRELAPWQRGALAAVLAYDVAMTGLKLAAAVRR